MIMLEDNDDKLPMMDLGFVGGRLKVVEEEKRKLQYVSAFGAFSFLILKINLSINFKKKVSGSRSGY